MFSRHLLTYDDMEGDDQMSFETIFENDVNFNFQINRLLSYGEEACNKEEIYEAAKKIDDVRHGIQLGVRLQSLRKLRLDMCTVCITITWRNLC